MHDALLAECTHPHHACTPGLPALLRYDPKPGSIALRAGENGPPLRKEAPLYKVQGDILSTVTEAMFRTWLAVLLVRGEEMTEKQWWQNYDTSIRSVFFCVKTERQDEEYAKDLNNAVVALLDVYDTAPAAAETGAGTTATGAGHESDEMAE